MNTFGFVQADPIRAPARAQDLTLRHRVKDYRAGDLERHFSTLDIHEDYFINYGFVTSAVEALMHPRGLVSRWPAGRRKRAQQLLEFVRDRGSVHPREVDRHFSHGTVTNYWGGSSSATTHLMDLMHYGGLLRVVRREAGIRIYALHEYAHELATPRRDGRRPIEGERAAEQQTRIDALVDVAVRKYAPLPAPSLGSLVRQLRYAIPQWRDDLKSALQRAKHRLARVTVDGLDWFWPADERPLRKARDGAAEDSVRLLTPFDPVVWDRLRFESLWGWPYRFEAYTPLAKRKLGYYALPLLWRDHVIGWANLSLRNGDLQSEVGYVAKRPPRDRSFARELEAEIDRVRMFLRLPAGTLPETEGGAKARSPRFRD